MVDERAAQMVGGYGRVADAGSGGEGTTACYAETKSNIRSSIN
jgi:hypothetical protein